MNCCDYNCNQGRDCPIRGAKVARVRSRRHDREELPPRVYPSMMRRMAHWALYAVIGLFWLAYVIAVVRWAHA